MKFCYLTIMTGAVYVKKMERQVEKLEYFRNILIFEFNRRAKAAEAARNICAVYWDNGIGESTEMKRFSRFKEDRFHFKMTLNVQEDLRGLMEIV